MNQYCVVIIKNMYTQDDCVSLEKTAINAGLANENLAKKLQENQKEKKNYNFIYNINTN